MQSWGIIGRLTPMELLAASFALGIVVIASLSRAGVLAFLSASVPLAIGIAAIAIIAVRLGVSPRLARALAGVALTFAIYAGLPPLLETRVYNLIDGILWEMERSWLGTTAVEALQPFVSDRLTVFFVAVYAVHAPLFFVPALIHWWRGRIERAEVLLLSLSIAMHLGFVGYAIWPAYGPVRTIPDLVPLGNNLGTWVVAEYGVALGTFPSLHAGISSAVAIDAWRVSPRRGLMFTSIAIAIWASTLYLRYHWVPDLLAGLVLAIVSLLLASRWHAAWSRLPRAATA
ncbi:MAG: phosphatase PAP2 family protein [Chloroflexota bacterium]|nr:MAG: phosphatase PAP2 family protein [Chloroflexota bacterium]